MEKKAQEIYLSVIIPAYNEEKRLVKTLSEINNYFKRQTYISEIIVVNDGSTDRTVDVVQNLMPEIKNLKILEFKEWHGKGFVVKQGMLEGLGKYRVFTDADNSTSIDQIERMWPEFEKGYDVVIGSRYIKGAVLAVPQPWFRKEILGRGFKLLRKLIIGLWEIEDTQCGFKCFREKAARDIFFKVTINRFGFDPETLVLAKKLGYKIKEVPISWINDREGKVRFKNVIEMFFETLKIRLNLILGRYEKKEKEIEPVVWRKTDLICALIIGQIVAWLTFGIFKNLGFDVILYRITTNFLGWTIHLGLLLAIIIPITALISLYITYLLGRKTPVIFQAGKFVSVGILSTLIDWGILNLFIFLSSIALGVFYSIFKGISFVVAMVNSFFWNKLWTFKKRGMEKAGKEFFQFLIINLIGLGINVIIASLIVNFIGPQFKLSDKIWANVGAGVATFFVMFWSFLGYKFIVFRK